MAEPTKRRLDDLLIPGRFLNVAALLLEFSVFSQAAFMYYMMYAGAAPKLQNCGNEVGTCSQFDAGNCSEPHFNVQFNSINVEWGYVCGLSRIVKKSISYQMVGVLVGTVVFGQLAEDLGRKIALLMAMVGSTIMFFATAFTFDLTSFTLIRTIGGFFSGGQIVLALVFMLETTPKSMRMWISLCISWSPNIIIFSALAYWTQSWQQLTLVVGIISVIPILILLFLVPESPRWLLQKGRLGDAKNALNWIYKLNKKVLDPATLEEVLNLEIQARQSSTKKSSYTLLDVFKHRSLAVPMIVLCTTIMFTAINSYGIIFNIEELSGVIYVNAALNGILRYSFNIMFAILEPRIPSMGRKNMHTFSVSVVLVALAVVIYGQFSEIATLKPIISFFLVLAASMASQLFLAISVTANELLPTPVRTTGYSLVQVFSRGGVIGAPLIFFLADISPHLPFLMMFTLGILQLILFQVFVPETKGQAMQEHMPVKTNQGYMLPPEQGLVTKM